MKILIVKFCNESDEATGTAAMASAISVEFVAWIQAWINKTYSLAYTREAETELLLGCWTVDKDKS